MESNELMEYAWSWQTCEDNRGRTILEVCWRRRSADDVARFVKAYKRGNDCELEFIDVAANGMRSFWEVRYNEDEED